MTGNYSVLRSSIAASVLLFLAAQTAAAGDLPRRSGAAGMPHPISGAPDPAPEKNSTSFDIKGAEHATLSFTVDVPGKIAVTIQSQGDPVTGILLTPGGTALPLKGASTLEYAASAEEINKGKQWKVDISLAAAKAARRNAALNSDAHASGDIAILHPAGRGKGRPSIHAIPEDATSGSSRSAATHVTDQPLRQAPTAVSQQVMAKRNGEPASLPAGNADHQQSRHGPQDASPPPYTPAPGDSGSPSYTPAPADSGSPSYTPASGDSGSPSYTPASGDSGSPSYTPAPGDSGASSYTPDLGGSAPSQYPQYQSGAQNSGQSQYQQPDSTAVQSPLQQQSPQNQQPYYQGQQYQGQQYQGQPYQGQQYQGQQYQGQQYQGQQPGTPPQNPAQPGYSSGMGAPGGTCSVKLSTDRSTIHLVDANTGSERKHLSLGQDRVQKVFTSPDNAWSVAVYKIRGAQQYGFIAIDLFKCEDQLPADLAAVPSEARFDQAEVVLTIADKERRFQLKKSRMQ